MIAERLIFDEKRGLIVGKVFRLVQTADGILVFSPSFLLGHVVSGVSFPHCTRGPTISLQGKRSNQMKVGEEIRAHTFLSSTRTRRVLL